MLITRTSMFTGRDHTMDLDVTEEQLARWQEGELIQNVFPHLTAEQREFLITGATKEEWYEAFGGVEVSRDEWDERIDEDHVSKEDWNNAFKH